MCCVEKKRRNMASIYLVQLIPLQPLLRNTFNCFSSNIILFPRYFLFLYLSFPTYTTATATQEHLQLFFSSNIILYPSLFFWGLFVFSNLYHTIRYELSLYFLKLIFRCANDNHDIIKASKILNQVRLAHLAVDFRVIFIF